MIFIERKKVTLVKDSTKRMSDQTKSLFIRIWVAGMVCLFVAWTPIGGGEVESNAFVYQLIFMLAFFLFLTNLIVVNPIIRGMFKTKLDASVYFNQSLLLRSLKNIGHFAKMLFITILIWGSYVLINLVLELLGFSNTSGKPLILLEPISFGFLYGLYYYLTEKVSYLIYKTKMPKEIKK